MLQAIKCHLGLVSESSSHPGLPDAKNATDRIWIKKTLSDDSCSCLFFTSSQTHICPVSRYQCSLCHYSWGWLNQCSISVAQCQLMTIKCICIYYNWKTIIIDLKTCRQDTNRRCRALRKETPKHLRSPLQFVHCHLLPGFSNHNEPTLLMQQSQTHKGKTFAIIFDILELWLISFSLT